MPKNTKADADPPIAWMSNHRSTHHSGLRFNVAIVRHLPLAGDGEFLEGESAGRKS